MPKMSAGEMLAAGRIKAGLSLREAAKRAKLSPTFLSQVERGKSKPTTKLLLSAHWFTAGIDRDELYASAKMLPPDIEITLITNPALWPKVRKLYS